LDCSDNQLSSMDASNNTALGRLICSENQLVKCRNSNITAEVRRIARDLFISERAVYRDLYSVVEDENEQ
jgi:hypothetical protein